MSSRPGSARFQAKYAPVYLTETDPADNDSDNDGSNLSHRPVEEDGNESDDELQRQLDQELLALRSLRDEELFGVKHGGDDASSSDESDGDELQQLINYKPRCTFRPMSARRLHSHPLSNGVTSSSRPGTAKNTRPTTANSAHVPPFHSTSDAAASTLATDSIAAPIHFAIDGIELDDSSAPLPRTLVEATLSALASSPTSARRPSSSPRSRPVTASKRKPSSKEEESKSFSTTAGKHHIPILPLPVPITLLPPLSSSPDPADSDGNDGFITNVEHDIAELRLLIAEAPPPSQMQQKLLQDGVDIAQWSKQQRESIAKETVEAQQKFEVQQRLQQEHLASMVAADQKNAQSSSSPENQPNGEDSSTNNAASSPTPTYSPPLLPPLLPSLAPNTDHITKSTTANNLNVDKQLARAREREAALEAFAAEEAANRLRQSQAIEQLRRDEFDQKKKEELYRKIELDNWTKQEEKRLREIKKKKQAREKELLEREAARKTTAFLVRERASMRGADSEARSLRQAKLDAEKREANRVANEKRMREQHAMQKEDERSTVLFQKAQAIRKEEQRRRREHEEAERKERERLEEVRLAATRAAEAEQKRLAEEYAARKREEARIQAEKEAAERARIEKEAEEKRRFEAEAQRMREELLRQQREAEEAERLRLEKLEAERLAAEAEKERLRQEAIARELERKAREEAERRAYFEEQRRRKEEADRAEAERKRIEEEEAERKRKEEEKERKRQEKLLRAQTKAAKLIQRVFRGYHSRVLSPTSRNQYKQLRQWKSARFVRHSRAATTIQAQARGWLLRRKLARIRSHAAHGLMDVDDGDEFDYGGIDPSFYTIQGLDEFEMNLPPEAMEMLKSAQMGDRSALVKQQTQQLKAQGLMGGINSNSNKKLPTHDRHVNVALEMERKFQATHQLTPVQNTNNQPQATLSKQRVSSAGTANASKLSSSGRGGLVSSQHSSGAPSPNISPPSSAAASQFLPPQQQNMRVNNFFGGQPSQQQPQQPQRLTQASLQQYDQQLQCDHAPPAVTKFPSLSTPTNNTQARVSTAHSDASDISHRSADHSARPESSFPSNVSVASLNSSPISGTSSKAAKLAELSAAWGVSDPRTLEALLKKKQKLAKMKSAKKAANMTADERYEKFQRASGTGGGGGKKKKKKGAAPPAWLTGGGQQASAGGVDSGDDDDDDGGEDDDVDDDRSSTASGIVASMTSNFRPLPHQNPILPLQSLSHSSSNRMDTSLLSPASSASSTYASSRSIAAPQSNFSFPTAVNTSAAAQPGGWMNAAASLKSSSGVIVNRKR